MSEIFLKTFVPEENLSSAASSNLLTLPCKMRLICQIGFGRWPSKCRARPGCSLLPGLSYTLLLCPCLQAMLVFIISGLVILAYCSQASNERTYQEVVWAVCGKLTGVLCEVAIAVYTFGTCIAFLIIIGDQQDKSEVPPYHLPPPAPSAPGSLGWEGKSMKHLPKT